MEQVIEDFANIAAEIVGGVIQSIPEPGTQNHEIMVGTLLALAVLIIVWLLLRLRSARLARQADRAFTPEMTFDDISAEAAAENPDRVTHHPAAEEATHQVNAAAHGPEGEPVSGFKFFKKKVKAGSSHPAAGTASAGTVSAGVNDVDDDIYLLGLEQEMLATRQLYLDGLISKEVYVTETRALYDKAQSRMT